MDVQTRRLCLPYSLQRHGSYAVIACLIVLGNMSSYAQVHATLPPSCKRLSHLQCSSLMRVLL